MSTSDVRTPTVARKTGATEDITTSARLEQLTEHIGEALIQADFFDLGEDRDGAEELAWELAERIAKNFNPDQRIVDVADLKSLLEGSMPLEIDAPDVGYAPDWLALHERLWDLIGDQT